MITKNHALAIMENSHSDRLSKFSDVDLAITIAAGVGNGSLSFFYPSKAAVKLKSKLRANGFYLETVTFRSMPAEEHITVFWDTDILSSEERNIEAD
jgi:hypothetical protein